MVVPSGLRSVRVAVANSPEFFISSIRRSLSILRALSCTVAVGPSLANRISVCISTTGVHDSSSIVLHNSSTDSNSISFSTILWTIWLSTASVATISSKVSEVERSPEGSCIAGLAALSVCITVLSCMSMYYYTTVGGRTQQKKVEKPENIKIISGGPQTGRVPDPNGLSTGTVIKLRF